MSYCHVANQVAVEANNEPHDECFNCEAAFTEDCNSTEVTTKRSGNQFICDDCIEDYITEGV